MKLKHIVLIGIVLCLLISIVPSIADKPIDIPTKSFNAEKKEVIVSSKDTQLTIKQISIKQGVCEFEEIFEITASKDYTPSRNRDFKLNYNYRKHGIKNRVSNSEWFVFKNGKWKSLNFGKILKGKTYKYKLVVHKNAELGSNEIQVVPSFLDVKCEELSWWNVSWGYRTNSTLNNVPSGGYTYQLNAHSGSGANNQTDIYLNNHAQADYDDIRFVLDETVELNYWIENNTANPSKVFVKVPSNGTVYIYYGNSGVSTTSNGFDTLYFFDDFEDGDISDWTCEQIGWHGTGSCELKTGYDSTYSARIYRDCYGYSIEYMNFYKHIPLDENWNYDINLWINASRHSILSCPRCGQYIKVNSTQYWNNCAYETIDWTPKEFDISSHSGTNAKVIFGCYAQNYGYDGWAKLWVDNVYIRQYLTPEPQWQLWSAEETEDTYGAYSPTQYNNQRKLARTSEGYLHRVYSKYISTDYEIYYGLSTDGGNSWTSEKLTGSNTNCTNPIIITDSNDSIWILYENESNGIWSLYKEGLLDWNNTQIPASIVGIVPSCAIDSNNNLHLTYQAGNNIHYIYYNGVIWSSAVLMSSGRYSSIGIDTNDYLHVVWEYDNNIRYRNKTGAGWQSIFNITENETYDQSYPCIAVDTSNNVHITWQTEDHKIKYRQNTGSWQATQTVCDGATYEQRNPTIVISDGTYVIWYGQTATYNTNYIIRYRKDTGGINDILHPSGKDAVYPNAIHAFHPKFCGADNCYANIPLTGFAIIYDEVGTENTVKYHSENLLWRCPSDHHTLIIKTIKAGTSDQIYNFTCTLDGTTVKSTTNGEVRYMCLPTNWYQIQIASSGYELFDTGEQGTFVDDNDEIKVFSLTPIGGSQYNVTVVAKNEKGTGISSFTASLDTGQEGSTDTGYIYFYNVSEGSRTVTVTASGYYAASDWFQLTNDTTRVVLLTSIEEGEPGGIAYKHLVEFQVMNYWGSPISDVFVEAKGIETTMGSWDWLWSIFGIKNETINESLVMNGTTDDYGRISFEMFEAIKYQITFVNAEKGVDETLKIYPKDEKYTVIVGTATSTKYIDEHMFWNLTAEQVNSTHFKLSLGYLDTLIETSTLKFFVLNMSGNEIYNKTFINPYMIFSSDANYIVEKEGGEEYMWGFIADHDTFGEIQDTKVITFKEFLDLGLEDEKYYTWISIALLVFFTGMFSVSLSKFGYVLVPGIGMLFWYIGWLGTNIALLITAMALGVLAYLGTREKEKGL